MPLYDPKRHRRRLRHANPVSAEPPTWKGQIEGATILLYRTRFVLCYFAESIFNTLEAFVKSEIISIIIYTMIFTGFMD